MWTKTMYRNRPNTCNYSYHSVNTPRTSESIAANIQKNPESIIIDLALPGYERTEINVKIEEAELVISTQVSDEAVSYNRKEFQKANLKRVFKLPANINKEEIEAKLEQGILKITLNKIKNNKTQINIL
ncbi:MAG: Hsp20/alpha crystallin family protein [Saprospiraceae bacterium]|nr:Hsp20/alpha crystallin family protein [Saprospiraceae bacterium]